VHTWYISKEYGSSSYMKTIASRSRSQEQKIAKIPIPALFDYQRRSGPIEDRAVKFALGMGFSVMTDRMMWPPSLSRDRK